MQAVDGEVAGEQAPVDAERLDGRLEPRRERRRRSSTRAAWPGPTACRRTLVAEPGERVDARLPERSLVVGRSSAASRCARRRRPGRRCAARPCGRGLRAGRGGPSARRRRPRSCERPQHLAGRQRAVERAHRADAPEPGGRHLPVEQLDGLGHRVGRREAADDGVGMAVDLGPAVELERLVDRVAARWRRPRSRASRRSTRPTSAW